MMLKYILKNICSEACFHSFSALAFGRRLVAAGRRFQAMGQYGQGELQKVTQVT